MFQIETNITHLCFILYQRLSIFGFRPVPWTPKSKPCLNPKPNKMKSLFKCNLKMSNLKMIAQGQRSSRVEIWEDRSQLIHKTWSHVCHQMGRNVPRRSTRTVLMTLTLYGCILFSRSRLCCGWIYAWLYRGLYTLSRWSLISGVARGGADCTATRVSVPKQVRKVKQMFCYFKIFPKSKMLEVKFPKMSK